MKSSKKTKKSKGHKKGVIEVIDRLTNCRDIDSFWCDRVNHKIRQILVSIDAMKREFVGDDWTKTQLDLHRPIYTHAATLQSLTSTGAAPSSEADAEDTQTLLAYLLIAGLSWSIVRFGQEVGSSTLTQAIALRFDNGMKNAATDSSTLNQALDRLIEKAGGGLFNYDAFCRVAYLSGYANVHKLHCLFDDFLFLQSPFRKTVIGTRHLFWTMQQNSPVSGQQKKKR